MSSGLTCCYLKCAPHTFSFHLYLNNFRFKITWLSLFLAILSFLISFPPDAAAWVPSKQLPLSRKSLHLQVCIICEKTDVWASNSCRDPDFCTIFPDGNSSELDDGEFLEVEEKEGGCDKERDDEEKDESEDEEEWEEDESDEETDEDESEPDESDDEEFEE